MGAHFTVEKTKARVHTARKAFRPTFVFPNLKRSFCQQASPRAREPEKGPVPPVAQGDF